MTGTGWIRASFAISGHFAFLVRFEKCLETKVLIFLGHNLKYKGGKCQLKLAQYIVTIYHLCCVGRVVSLVTEHSVSQYNTPLMCCVARVVSQYNTFVVLVVLCHSSPSTVSLSPEL